MSQDQAAPADQAEREAVRLSGFWVTVPGMSLDELIACARNNASALHPESILGGLLTQLADALALRAQPVAGGGDETRVGSDYEFEVWQEDEFCATASSPDREKALAEAQHYAAVYGQDGPTRIVELKRFALSRSAPEPGGDEGKSTTFPLIDVAPCPFCGPGTEIRNWVSTDHGGGSPAWSVMCCGCECEGPHTNDEREAVRLWNSRPTDKCDPRPAPQADARVREKIALERIEVAADNWWHSDEPAATSALMRSMREAFEFAGMTEDGEFGRYGFDNGPFDTPEILAALSEPDGATTGGEAGE